jgi:hypothetical protein
MFYKLFTPLFDMKLIGPIEFDTTFKILYSFWLLFFLALLIFNKFAGNLLARYIAGMYKFWYSQDNKSSKAYGEFIGQVGGKFYMTEKGKKLGSKIVFIISLICLLFLIFIGIYGLFFQ